MRLAHGGFESRKITTANGMDLYDGDKNAGFFDPIIDTTNQRTGVACMEFGAGWVDVGDPFLTLAQGVRVFKRIYVRIPTLGNGSLWRPGPGVGESSLELRITSAGKFTFQGASSVLTAVAGQWYRTEIAVQLGTGATDFAECRVAVASDNGPGETVFSSSSLNVADGSQEAGLRLEPTDVAVQYDDWAINDNSVPAGLAAGSLGACDSWCGPGRVYLLNPVASVSFPTGWSPAEATARGYVAARPPTYTDFATNSTNNGNWDLEVEDFAAKGITDPTILAAYAVGVFRGPASGLNPTVAIAGVSNPAAAERARTLTAGDQDDTSYRSEVAHLPAVVRGTRPVIRVGRRVQGQVRVGSLGLYVEASPLVVPGGLTMLPG